MRKNAKLMLKGLSEESGAPFTKEIHSLDEVKNSGNYLVVGRNISAENGLPVISGKTHDCFCCEAQLTVTCCYPESESQSDTAYGQTLTICDRETGTTATYARSISPTKNSGMWTPWLMVATGDIELITGNNQLNELLSVLSNKIDSEVERSQQAEDEILTNLSRMEIKSASINLAVNDGVTVRFDRIEESEASIIKEKIIEPNEVVFYKPARVFVAADSNGNYYDTWSDSEQYMSRGTIHKNKIYICGTDIYVWDGEMLTNVIENINDYSEEITDRTKAFLIDKIETEKRALKNGDTIVGLSREIYSRQGKTDSATFLRRTTAGGTSVSDGVASIKQIGGNILKNLADGTFISSDNYNRETGETLIFTNNTCLITTSSANIKYGGIKTKSGKFIIGHIYYASVYVFNVDALSIEISIDGGTNTKTFTEKGRWIRASMVEEKKSTSENLNNATIRLRKNEGGIVSARVCNWLVIDLTEHFGAGNEPTLEECDKMFASVGPLPQGLFIAQPTGFKSIGYNHWNPENVIVGKNVVNSQITTNEGTSIAVVKCVLCKEGVGENNGYVIGYGEAENWSDDGIEVYLSPLNPMETSGELFLQKLEKGTAQTYIPDISGYLLIVTPVTEKLCVHLHWSADRATTDYEPYTESYVVLPEVPNNELAAISSSGIMAQDIIDLDKNIFIKKINKIDLGDVDWIKTDYTWKSYTNGTKFIYVPGQLPPEYTFSESDYTRENRIQTEYNASDDTYTISTTKGEYLEGDVFTRSNDVVIHKVRSEVKAALSSGDYSTSNIICDKYLTIQGGQAYYGTCNTGIGVISKGYISIVDKSFQSMTVADIKEYLKGTIAFYELPEYEEYSIKTKSVPHYFGSDYGVEAFEGSTIPLAANIFFYMRSLVSEVRNFLDRLMVGLGSDVVAVADRIIASISSTEANTVAMDNPQ